MKGSKEVTKAKLDQIIKIAIKMFETTSFEKVTIRRIADKAGIGAATIYGYFDSKDALLQKIMEVKGVEMWQQLDEAMAKANSPEEKLISFTHGYLKHFEENKGLGRFITFGVPWTVWDDKKSYAGNKEIGYALISIILEGQRQNIFRTDIELRLFSSIYFGGIERLVQRNNSNSWPYSLYDAEKQFTGLMLYILKNKPDNTVPVIPDLSAETGTSRKKRRS